MDILSRPSGLFLIRVNPIRNFNHLLATITTFSSNCTSIEEVHKANILNGILGLENNLI
jgi:hypothetical protein